MSDARFAGQSAIVTGGGAGLGKHIAARLAREGAAVTLWDLDRAAVEKAAFELRATPVALDVSDEDSVKNAVSRPDRLDIVVHCAGISPAAKNICETPTDEFDRVLRVNLRSSFLVTKYALERMRARNYGRILLFASIAGKEGNANMVPYSVSKAGVIGLAKSVGKEFAETGITVNSIAPAVIRTAMVEGLPESQVKYMTDKIPMKRTGTLDEVASLACWIVSPEASFNTGFTFDLSGGRATY